KADVIVALDSDFLNDGPASLVYARQFAASRRVIDSGRTPSRLYAIESIPTVSGSIADHRFSLESGKIPALAYQLAKACGVAAPDAPGTAPDWVRVVAQ